MYKSWMLQRNMRCTRLETDRNTQILLYTISGHSWISPRFAGTRKKNKTSLKWKYRTSNVQIHPAKNRNILFLKELYVSIFLFKQPKMSVYLYVWVFLNAIAWITWCAPRMTWQRATAANENEKVCERERKKDRENTKK